MGLLTRSVQPLLNGDRARGKPHGVDIGAQAVACVVVTVAVREEPPAGGGLGGAREELLAEGN